MPLIKYAICDDNAHFITCLKLDSAANNKLEFTGEAHSESECMDMIENSIRSQGRPHFCLDSCIVALEAFADVNAENRKDFQVIRQYAYE